MSIFGKIKEAYPQVSPRIDVYAPPGWDLDQHLERLAGFNCRAERPTAWIPEVHAGPDFFDRMLRERPGNVVVLSGRNGMKIDYIERSVAAGLNALLRLQRQDGRFAGAANMYGHAIAGLPPGDTPETQDAYRAPFERTFRGIAVW